MEVLYKLSLVGAKFDEVPFELRYDNKLGESKMRVLRTVKDSITTAFRLRFSAKRKGEDMEETLKKQKFSVYNIIFIIVVIAQLIFLSVSFAVNNTAHHEDEYFSYGLANSQNRVYLYGSAFQVPDNYNVWMTGDDFKYYIETNEESRFSYDTVWKNQAADTHPPLYYAALHTICSFSPISSLGGGHSG